MVGLKNLVEKSKERYWSIEMFLVASMEKVLRWNSLPHSMVNFTDFVEV